MLCAEKSKRQPGRSSRAQRAEWQRSGKGCTGSADFYCESEGPEEFLGGHPDVTGAHSHALEAQWAQFCGGLCVCVSWVATFTLALLPTDPRPKCWHPFLFILACKGLAPCVLHLTRKATQHQVNQRNYCYLIICCGCYEFLYVYKWSGVMKNAQQILNKLEQFDVKILKYWCDVQEEILVSTHIKSKLQYVHFL